MSDLPPSLLRNLAILRWFAVIGQGVTVVLAVDLLGVPIETRMLWPAIGLLFVFNVWATWHAARASRFDEWQVLAQIAVDVIVLAWLIGWSGGAMNPFTSLFLLPIAMVAIALPPRWVVATAILCGAGYGLSTALGRPLPHVLGAFGTALDLHLWGMAVNFIISAILVTLFLTRLARGLRERETELARLREQFARREGIVALATHAASVAHELNTPLGALTLLLEDQLDRQRLGETPQYEDWQTMATLVNACRDRVRELALPASGAMEGSTLTECIDRVVERWQLLRPTIALERSGVVEDYPGVSLDPGIGHLLQALLNNAADASEAADESRVSLHIRTNERVLCGDVRDFGRGFDADKPLLPRRLFDSSKPEGLGVGLALSHATVERLNGDLSIRNAVGGGTRVSFRLPLTHEGVPQ
ncbi:MAG: HAMP domain-containing histidine kinase [Proteobacteria bacterium]|uniref:ATP-binding protein n=1 Tax=Rudaea sp. TaxID=2136325 RepID=UPI00321FA6FE|nr:HAMP domain-containing histidine kinase [Pseudomonadota bacterium]